MVASSRYSTPIIVRTGSPDEILIRVSLGRDHTEASQREKFIQELVHNRPGILPMADIEPAFAPLISVAMELPTAAGYLDNLWVTPAGGLVIGECKLVRNPEARREVVAQALDYARAIAGWTFGQLESAVQTAHAAPSLRLWDFVKEQTDLDEAQFVDAIERRLRTRRLMILIIGDGIQEGVEALTAHLQLHAGLHVSLALVELSLWRRDTSDELLVIPRVPMRTVLIERGVVSIEPSGAVRIDPPRDKVGVPTSGRALTISEEEFYTQLDERCGHGGRLRVFLGTLEDALVRPSFTKTALRAEWQSDDGPAALIGTFGNAGLVWFTGVPRGALQFGQAAAGERYLQTVADIAQGTIKRYGEPGSLEIVKSSGSSMDLSTLLPRAGEWKAAILNYIDALRNGSA